MSNFQNVVLQNDHRIDISSIVRETSFDLYQTKRHYDICQVMSRQVAKNSEEEKFFINLFSLKSSLARTATALSFFLESNKDRVAELNISNILVNLLAPSLTKNLKIRAYREKNEQYLSFSHVMKLVLKAIMHGTFRLLSNDKNSADNIVRGWVEVTERLYPEEINDGLLCIYPFALGSLRQIKFIRHCSKKGVRFTLTGMPYKLWTIIRDIINGISNERILFNAEMNANRMHAKELLAKHPQKIYSSDEYETGVFFLYEKLVKAGVYAVNTAHGVGQYCPNICYSEFRALSKSQADFYKGFNDGIKFSLIKTDYNPIKLPLYSLSLKKEPAIVLIHQPFKESLLFAEDEALHYLDLELKQISDRLSIHYFVKMHPNYNRSSAKENKFFGENIYDWQVLDKYRLIFVTINSSVYFDLRGIGPILVYCEPTFIPSLYFPDDFMMISRMNIKSKVESILNVSEWKIAAKQHANYFEHN